MRLSCLLVLPTLAVLFSACASDSERLEGASQSSAEALGAPGAGMLPAPSRLELEPRPRRASYVESDLIKSGAGFEASLPHQRVVVQGTELEFSPQHGAASGFSDLAFAIYAFSIPDYDRAALVRTAWSDPPVALSDLWYGLANWDENRWDWWPAPQDLSLQLSSFEPYFSFGGDLLFAVVRTGTDPSTLSSVRLAAPLPSAQLAAVPDVGVPPFVIELDAGASSSPEGSIVKYEFDTGSGIFLDYGTDADLLVEVDSPGLHVMRVRVTDSLGGKDIAETAVQSAGPWQHTYSRGYVDDILDVAAAANGDVYACGQTRGFDTYVGPLVLKYNAVGQLQWAKGFGSSGQFNSCALDSEGNLILGGNSGEGTYVALLHKWSPDGEVIWKRGFAPSGGPNAEITDVAAWGDATYAAAYADYADGDSDLLGLRVGPDGFLQWARRWTWGTTQTERSTVCALNNEGTELLVGGVTSSTIGDPPPFIPLPIVIGWSAEGSLVRDWQFGDGNTVGYLHGLLFEGTGDSTRIIALGRKTNSPDSRYRQFLVRTLLTGSTIAGLMYEVDGSVYPNALAAVPWSAGFLTAGSMTGGYGFIVELDPASLTPGLQLRWGSSGRWMNFSGLSPSPLGGLVLGGSTNTSTSSLGTFSGSSTQFLETFRTLNGGTEFDAGIALLIPNDDVFDLTDGRQDEPTIAGSALVRYEQLGG